MVLNMVFSLFQSTQNTSKRNSNPTADSIASPPSTVNREPSPDPRPNIILSHQNRQYDRDSSLEDIQKGFLSGDIHGKYTKMNQPPKSLSSGTTNGQKAGHRQLFLHHNRNSSDSNSSTEDIHSRRVALMMASPALPPRNNSSREKHRRRTRSSSRRSSKSIRNGQSQPLPSDENGGSCDTNEVLSPFAVRRKPRKVSSVQDTKRPTTKSYDEYSSDKQHYSEYYSPEFSSESSPDSSPSRRISDMYRLQQHQYRDPSLQGQQFSSSRNSLSSKSSLGRGGNESNPNFKSQSNQSQSPRKFKGSKTKTMTSNKSCSVAGTFIGMVILSLFGMISLTKRAVPTTILQDQFVLPDESGLRGKQVLGRMWDTSATTSEDLSISQDIVGSKKRAKNIDRAKRDDGSSAISAVSSSGETKTTKSRVKKDDNGSSMSETKTKKSLIKGAKMPPPRFRMHSPPSESFKREPKFENVDRNLYYPSSRTRTVVEADSIPRIVMLDPSVKRVKRKIKIYPADFTDNTQLYGVLSSDDERLKGMEIRHPYATNECVPMQEWQTAYQPTCNGMHELALQSLGSSTTTNEEISQERWRGRVEGLNATLFGTKGFWRYAWKLVIGYYVDRRAQRDTIVFKNLKYEHNFEDAHFEHDRVDAVAMERLTSSPHVINIFGFCGHSVMTEYADGKRLGELADKSKKIPLKRLEIARDIANGLADVHGIDGDGNTTFVHLDVNPANVVSVNQTLKLNDFNIGIIRQWNTTSNEACGFPTQYPNPQWRSPEEARNEQHLTEKVDIFSLGHIFFRLICGHEPWNKLEPGGRPTKSEVNEKVQRGELPFIPDHVRTSEDPEVIAIRDMMLKCYSFDPNKRPSARHIANALDHTLQKYLSNPSKPTKSKTEASASAVSSK